MHFSFGFVVVLLLILFPGLLFRRLYYYGEFSKQFYSGQNLLKLISTSIIPGIIILIKSFFLYHFFFEKIDLGIVIDYFKDINNPEYRLSKTSFSFNHLLYDKLIPFVSFLYLISFILGGISGRLIRITKLDISFKLLRFKNHWFYLFNGHHSRIKRMKHSKEVRKKHLFTKADILIDSNSQPLLYSGIVVDYELDENDCTVLSKLILQSAQRYSISKGKKIATAIPGNLLVVDCLGMTNINLTYVYDEMVDSKESSVSKRILKSKIPNSIEVVLSLIYLLLIPVFIFKSESIDLKLYTEFFKRDWYIKVLVYFITIQILSLLNPFVIKNEEYQYVGMKSFFAKLIWIFIMFLGLYFWY